MAVELEAVDMALGGRVRALAGRLSQSSMLVPYRIITKTHPTHTVTTHKNFEQPVGQCKSLVRTSKCNDGTRSVKCHP